MLAWWVGCPCLPLAGLPVLLTNVELGLGCQELQWLLRREKLSAPEVQPGFCLYLSTTLPLSALGKGEPQLVSCHHSLVDTLGLPLHSVWPRAGSGLWSGAIHPVRPTHWLCQGESIKRLPYDPQVLGYEVLKGLNVLDLSLNMDILEEQMLHEILCIECPELKNRWQDLKTRILDSCEAVEAAEVPGGPGPGGRLSFGGPGFGGRDECGWLRAVWERVRPWNK